MRDYSFRYLDAHGRTQASDYLQMPDNETAIAFGRECLSRSDVVEVWAGNKLILTLKAESAPLPPATDETTPETAAPVRRHPQSGPGVDGVSITPWIRPVR